MRITVVLPAYNAEKTLEQTYREIPFDIVDHVILVDDSSRDQTLQVAEKLGIHHIIRHEPVHPQAAPLHVLSHCQPGLRSGAGIQDPGERGP